MAIAAVPTYLGTTFSSASPGMRFGMYLKLWGTNNRSGERLWSTHDLNYRVVGKDKIEREFKDENKTSALSEATRLTPQDRQAMAALVARQTALAEPLRLSGQLLRVDANAVAPFTTGLGNEHPLENGFAFLNPYGLPYLPGSGVKGVLRQAARELARGDWGESHGWDESPRFTLVSGNDRIALTLLDVLFGKQGHDGETEHVRGALRFWDVYPQITGTSLAVEVMTAHQSHYLQGSDTPHESGQPNPINFLTVPPGAHFHFHIQCDQSFLARVAPELAAPEIWQPLLTAALEHAFDWLGFGAKTAVGYGALRRDRSAEEARRKADEERCAQQARDEAERQRQAAEAAEAARQQAAFEALPEADKALLRFEEGLADLGDGPVGKDLYPEFARLVNTLAEQAQAWPDKTDRERAATALETALDRFGWTQPGASSDRRKKQKKKRQDLIDGVRNGHI
jgi:CRISPR-associated protein Cmr6